MSRFVGVEPFSFEDGSFFMVYEVFLSFFNVK